MHTSLSAQTRLSLGCSAKVRLWDHQRRRAHVRKGAKRGAACRAQERSGAAGRRALLRIGRPPSTIGGAEQRRRARGTTTQGSQISIPPSLPFPHDDDQNPTRLVVAALYRIVPNTFLHRHRHPQSSPSSSSSPSPLPLPLLPRSTFLAPPSPQLPPLPAVLARLSPCRSPLFRV